MLPSSPGFFHFLAAPVFQDEEKTRIARLLNTILIGMILISVLNSLTVLLFIARPLNTWWINLLVIGILLFIQQISRKGHVYSASLIFCVSLWLVLMVSSINYNGIKDLLYISIMVAIVAASLLLGTWVATLMTAATLFIGLLEVIQSGFSDELNRYWIGTSSIFIGNFLLFYLADRSIKQSLKEARNSTTRTNFINQALYTEIANHQSTTNALRESEERYRQLLENSPVGIAVYAVPDFTIQYINPRGVKLLGASAADEIIGQSAADFAAPELDEDAAASRAKVIAGETVTDTFTMRRLDGQTVLMEAITIPIVYEGKPATLNVFQDITERVLAEESLLHAEHLQAEIEKERHAIQLRENFVNMISHQFRNPLAVIQTSKELMENYQDRMTPEGRKEHLHRIGHQALYMKDMLEDLLTISKGSAGMLQFQPAALELTAFCTQLIHGFQENYPSHQFIFEGQLAGFYMIDDKLLRHALTNLLSNAVKYSPNGSNIQLILTHENNTVKFTVRDFGMGISPEDQSHLFETFFRAGNVRQIQGTGLGLSIVKAMVETHRGKVFYVPPPDGGSEFTIQLPLEAALEMG